MKLIELQKILNDAPAALIEFHFEDGTKIPAQFHVTEVGRVQKDFIDCGGTVRSTTTCLVQTWIGQDNDHRLVSAKFAKILSLAEPVLRSTDLDVEVEYEGTLTSQFLLHSAQSSADLISLLLKPKHTDCLAKDLCSTPRLKNVLGDCCSTDSGCC